MEKSQAGIENKQSKNDIVKSIRAKKRIKDSEDFSPLRAKVLGMVRRHSEVKNAFTKDGLMHAILNRGKVFIDSASDRYKLGICDPSHDELGISASIFGVTMKRLLVKSVQVAFGRLCPPSENNFHKLINTGKVNQRLNQG